MHASGSGKPSSTSSLNPFSYDPTRQQSPQHSRRSPRIMQQSRDLLGLWTLRTLVRHSSRAVEQATDSPRLAACIGALSVLSPPRAPHLPHPPSQQERTSGPPCAAPPASFPPSMLSPGGTSRPPLSPKAYQLPLALGPVRDPTLAVLQKWKIQNPVLSVPGAQGQATSNPTPSTLVRSLTRPCPLPISPRPHMTAH